MAALITDYMATTPTPTRQAHRGQDRLLHHGGLQRLRLPLAALHPHGHPALILTLTLTLPLAQTLTQTLTLN